MKFSSKEEELAYNNLSSVYVLNKQNIAEYLQAQLSYIIFNIAAKDNAHQLEENEEGYKVCEVVLPFLGRFNFKFKSIDSKEGKDVDIQVDFDPSNKLKNDLNHMVHDKMPPTTTKHLQKISKKIKSFLGIN
jgi:hypothetical protein